MKMFSKILGIAFLVGGVLATFSSCSSDESMSPTILDNKGDLHTVTMKLVGNCEGFDAINNSRAGESAMQWEDGAKLYLQFTVGSKLVAGNATYNKTNDAWTVSYYGTISTGESAKCQAYYFEGATETNSIVQLSDRTPIYEDINGAYLFDGENLTVTANLKPKTGRMRFAGQKGTPVVVAGISYYSSYDVSSNSFLTMTKAVKDTVDVNTLYTPYIYGYFTDSEAPSLKMVINSEEAYTMDCPATMYKTGESGYLDVPTTASHNGWATGLNFTVNGVEFKMIPVAYKDGDFLIGETEVTEGLYNAVTDNDESTTSKYPVSNYNYSTFTSFISKLNYLTGMAFRLPTGAEWMYAFKGGKNTLEYTYSGSNSINDVAWYSANSGGIKHEVKQKMPNELGLYDMSGNVSEWTSSKRSSSSSYYYYCGGSFGDATISFFQGTSYIDDEYTASAYRGIRLALTLK